MLVLDEGRSIASLARSLGIGATNLCNGVRQPRVGRGEREGLTDLDVNVNAKPLRPPLQLRLIREAGG